LPQYRFLWSLKRVKYDVDIPHLESHVRIQDFVPQAQVLAHRNVKVFLSHCGQNSFLEAIWSAVPILALPFMADQVRLLRAPMPCNAHATAHC
jgi:UDP:flavonoid glycosyltransferase YjiC (YdhE family)